MSKKVLLIGGAGFIGLNIIKALTRRGNYQITIADNFFRGKLDQELQSLVDKYGIKVVTDDFTKPEAFSELDNDFDYVYMLASVVGVEYTMKMPHELIRINSFLILNTLEWMKNSNCKKILFTSTSECYAGTVESFNYSVPTSEEVPLCINDVQHPRFTYAITKLLGESGFIQYSRAFDFQCTIVRYHNVYGPRMGFKHVIPQVVQRFLKNENPFKIYGFDQTRAFNFIDDAVTGTIGSMESENTNHEILHIGDMNSEITIEELVNFIGGLTNFNGSYEHVEAHDGSVSRRCPDTTKAKNLIGYHPKISWQQGVEKTVEWYKEYYLGGGVVFE